MEVYSSRDSIILCDVKGHAKIIHINVGNSRKFNFYEAKLPLDEGEKITTFYKEDNIIVYHTTGKCIIASTIKKISYNCLYNLPGKIISGDTDISPSYHPHESRVLAENVEVAMAGDDYMVYYDGISFCMICDESRCKAEMMYLIMQHNYSFYDLCRKHIIVPFNPSPAKVEVNNIYGNDHVNYMVCHTPHSQHVLVAAKASRSVECYYVHAPQITLTKDNLIVKTRYPEMGNNIRIQIVIYHEQKVYIYIPERQDLKVLEGIALESTMKNDMVVMKDQRKLFHYPEEHNFADPIIITKKYRKFMSTCEGKFIFKTIGGTLRNIMLVNTDDTSCFDENDVCEVDKDTYAINRRDRFVEANEYFIVLADVDGTLSIYSTEKLNIRQKVAWNNILLMYKTPLYTHCSYTFGQEKITGTCQVRDHMMFFVDHGQLIFVLKFDIIYGSYQLSMHLVDFEHKLGIVNSSLVNYEVVNYSNRMYFKILENDQSYLRDTLNFTRYSTPRDEVSVTLMTENNGMKKMIAQGNGVTRFFMTNACKELADLYFEPLNVWPFLRVTIINLSRQELLNIGAMLHMVILHMPGPLNIHLPLILVEAIKGTPITIVEFEVFARIQDLETFHRLYAYKNKPQEFHNLETGYASYEEALKHMCGYPDAPNMVEFAKLQYTCNIIKQGFLGYYPITNMDLMNIVTLNYYLSGDHVIDRDKLIENINVNILTAAPHDRKVYEEKLYAVINSVTEVELRNILINWSGTSSLCKSYKVYVIICGNLKFHCCNVTVDIPHMCFEDNANLKEFLVTPIQAIVD